MYTSAHKTVFFIAWNKKRRKDFLIRFLISNKELLFLFPSSDCFGWKTKCIVVLNIVFSYFGIFGDTVINSHEFI